VKSHALASLNTNSLHLAKLILISLLSDRQQSLEDSATYENLSPLALISNYIYVQPAVVVSTAIFYMPVKHGKAQGRYRTS